MPDYVVETLKDINRQLDRLEVKVDSFLVRVDRLEQAHARQKWWHRSAWASVIAAAIGFLIDRLTNP